MKTDESDIAPIIEALRSAKSRSPSVPLFRLKFPDELLRRIDAAVKLRGLKKKEITAELFRDIVIEVMDDESQQGSKRNTKRRRLKTERDSSESHRV
jgi:hypothetical protein